MHTYASLNVVQNYIQQIRKISFERGVPCRKWLKYDALQTFNVASTSTEVPDIVTALGPGTLTRSLALLLTMLPFVEHSKTSLILRPSKSRTIPSPIYSRSSRMGTVDFQSCPTSILDLLERSLATMLPICARGRFEYPTTRYDFATCSARTPTTFGLNQRSIWNSSLV